MISNKKFVNINIQPSSEVSINATRDTVVLMTNESGIVGTTETSYTFSIADYNYTITNSENGDLSDGLLHAYKNNEGETVVVAIPSTMEHTLQYLDVFFKNGGLKCKVITGITYDLTSDNPTINIENAVKALDDKYIVVAYADTNTVIDEDVPSSNVDNIYTIMKNVITNLNNDSSIYGINEKLILAGSLDFNDSDKIKNFIVKYSFIEGAEMTIAAYLSQVNVYGINSIQDYMFTKEIIKEEDVSNSDYDSIIENDYNVDIDLQGDIRNCGGNDKDGDSVINNYVRIVLHQTLTDRLIGLLKTKIKGVDGVSKIYATIVDELERYITNGYLTSDIYNKETLVIDNEVIITKGTPLPKGYYIKVLPMSVLSTDDRKKGYCPPIYIIIADQYSIRVINIQGEAI